MQFHSLLCICTIDLNYRKEEQMYDSSPISAVVCEIGGGRAKDRWHFFLPTAPSLHNGGEGEGCSGSGKGRYTWQRLQSQGRGPENCAAWRKDKINRSWSNNIFLWFHLCIRISPAICIFSCKKRYLAMFNSHILLLVQTGLHWLH